MIPFKQYFSEDVLLEIKASAANIERFEDDYRVNMDEDEIKDWFDRFTKQVKRGTLKNKDIFGYSAFDGVTGLGQAIIDAEQTKTKGDITRIEKEQSTKVFQNDKVLVVHPKSHEASCHYGSGSRWCTAAKDDSSHFKQYTEDQDVVLLYFLPKAGFEAERYTFGEMPIDNDTIDRMLLGYPEAFDWSYDSFSKSIGKYILAAYLHGRESEPISTIATWSQENAIAVNQARINMERAIKNYNINGAQYAGEVLGDQDDGREGAGTDVHWNILSREGLLGLVGGGSDDSDWVGWTHPTGGASKQRTKDFEFYIKPIMDKLHKTAADIGRPNPVKDRRYDKIAVAVYAMGIESEINDLEGHGFGNFTAEAYDAGDEPMDVDKVLKMFGISKQDELKMSEYVQKFSEDKIWTSGDPNKLFNFLEKPSNQTPENIKRADEHYLSQPNAEFSRGAWSYAREIRSKANMGRTKRDEYLHALGDEREKRRDWPELEAKMIKSIDEAVKEEIRVKDLKRQTQTWAGVQEIRADLEKEHGEVRAPEPTEWVNTQYKDWIKNQEMPINNFMSNATGLLGYLFHVKKYNWPELEKRVLDPKYYFVGLTMLGPDFIQHGRRGARWKDFEDTLQKMWTDITSTPYTNQKDIDAAAVPHEHPSHASPHYQPTEDYPNPAWWEKERAKNNLADHYKFHGNIESVIDLVKASKRALGGGAGGSEPAAWNAAKDAWWNDPDIVKEYWGRGVIVKKQKPSQKRRGKKPTTYFVNGDGYIKRPFYHEVKPGAWLKRIPDPFQIDGLGKQIRYVGQAGSDPHDPRGWGTVGGDISRHDQARRGA